jgi:glycosyltransferase involved in cell wall biosynthesis/GT2 family glycosyltransferase
MKVCILTERMRLGFGVDLVVDQQACRLVKLGFEVVVVVIHADLVQPPRPYKLVVINRIMHVGDFGSEPWIKRVLFTSKVDDADLWILHTPPFYDWARYLNGPVILVEHGAPPGHFFAPEVGQHIDTMADRRLNEIYGGLLPCDAIVSISHSIHEWLPKTAQPLSAVIHHGCDHYAPVLPDEAKNLRSSVGIRQDECMILWVGRMQLESDEQPYKGFQELLTLIPFVRRQVENARFVLVGRVSHRDRDKLRDHGVVVLANLKSEEMARAYAAADVLINLAKWEGFNLALLEAQFQGTPVVAYDLGPHPEIVRHNETGLLAKTPQGLFQSVVRIATDRALRETLAGQAPVFARDFTWDASLAKLAKVMTACASRSPSRTEVAALREKAVQLGTHSRGAATASEILRLCDRDFVRTARAALLGQAPNEAAEASWLRKLRRGVDKRAILLEMTDSAKDRGVERKISGLQANLVRARARRLARQAVAGWRRMGSSGPSLWWELQSEIFVQHAYRVLLGREAEGEAVDTRVALLRNGYSRRTMLGEIRFSEEGKARPLVDPDLRRILPADDKLERQQRAHRPVAAWWEFASNLIRLGKPLPSSEWFLFDSDEFVRHAFRVLLGREAEQEAVDGWVAQLRNGYSRRAILATIRFSDEGRARPLHDPQLRRILFAAKLRRTLRITRVLGNRGMGDGGPEDLSRQIRRIDSQQRSFAADFRRFGAILERTAHDVQTLPTVVERLDALEAGIGAWSAAQSRAAGSTPTAQTPPDLNLGEPFASVSTALQLSPFHVALVAPGAVIDPAALSQLAQAAEATSSDIVFGDEYERLDKPPFRRLRIQGPFSHEAFLRSTDLGGVIAVHMDLLKRMQWPSTVAATGQVVLQLVALAHTIAYVRATLCERASADITANRPTIADVQSYVGRIGRRALVAKDSTSGFDVRFPAASGWKAAIVVVAQGDEGDLELSLSNVRANTAQHQCHLLLVQTTEKVGDASEPSSKVDRTETVLTFPSGTQYGRMVNEAVRRASKDCNLIVVMDGGVSPTAPDWLERLAESALISSTGVVAPKTLYPNGRIRHAGMALGMGDPCGYVSRFVRSDDLNGGNQDVDLDRLNGMRELSVVSHHCMMFRRSVFLDQGQLAEQLGRETSDIEFCCRLHRAGLSVLLDGRIVMVQPDPAPRWARALPPDDLAALRAKHGHFLAGGDRFWNPARSSANAAMVEATGLRMVRLPPLKDR